MWKFRIRVFVESFKDPEDVYVAGDYIPLIDGEVGSPSEIISSLNRVISLGPSGKIELEMEKVEYNNQVFPTSQEGEFDVSNMIDYLAPGEENNNPEEKTEKPLGKVGVGKDKGQEEKAKQSQQPAKDKENNKKKNPKP